MAHVALPPKDGNGGRDPYRCVSTRVRNAFAYAIRLVAYLEMGTQGEDRIL